MKIVIDIPEELYKANHRGLQPEELWDLRVAIENGTPLQQKEEQLIEKLSKMQPMVIETAYLYAINYTEYGENVTEKWVTAVQQTSILEKAYRRGYYDALEERGKQESEE